MPLKSEFTQKDFDQINRDYEDLKQAAAKRCSGEEEMALARDSRVVTIPFSPLELRMQTEKPYVFEKLQILKEMIGDEKFKKPDKKNIMKFKYILEASGKKVTTVIIAHRLSTIKNADWIYAIKEGKVIEQGTHAQLVAKKGYYEGLVRSQMGQEELEKKEENLERLKKDKSSTHRMTSDVNLFGDKKVLVYINKEDVQVSRIKIFMELKGYMHHVFLASFGATCLGVIQPVFGWLMAK